MKGLKQYTTISTTKVRRNMPVLHNPASFLEEAEFFPCYQSTEVPIFGILFSLSSSGRSPVNITCSVIGLFPPQSQKIIMDGSDRFYLISIPTFRDVHNNCFTIWKRHFVLAEGEVHEKQEKKANHSYKTFPVPKRMILKIPVRGLRNLVLVSDYIQFCTAKSVYPYTCSCQRAGY